MTDPRRIPGGMAGPGGPHDVGGVVLDARHAVLLDPFCNDEQCGYRDIRLKRKAATR